MRVLMVGPSGVIAMRRPLKWVLEAGHEVLLVDYANQYASQPPPNLRFAPFLARGAARLHGLFRTPRAAALVSWAGAMQLRLLAARFRPDVVHVHKIDARAVACARAGLTPLVLSAWGTLNHLLIPAVSFGSLATAQSVLRATDALIIETPHLIEPIQRLAGRPLRVELLPLGTDTTRFRPLPPAETAAWRQKLEIPAEAVLFLSPRGWLELYNHHLILEAYGLAQGRFGRATALAFLTLGLGHYDEATGYHERLRARAEALGIAGQLRWLRPLPFDKMPLLYALADVVVNYPATDAFPSTLIEAAAAGRAVLTARLPTYAGSFIEQHLTTVAPNDPPALAEAMVAAVNAPPPAARLAAARDAVVAEYDEAGARARLLALYESVRRTS